MAKLNLTPPNKRVVIWFVIGLVLFTMAARKFPMVSDYVGLR